MEKNEARGRQLLTAVERLVSPSSALREVAGECRKAARAKDDRKLTQQDLAAVEAVRRYSNRAAFIGGASCVPSLIPGAGLVAALGSTLAELAMLLKTEVEMTLVLLDLHGYDIDDPRERQLGFLLASVGTYDASTRKSVLEDLARAEGQAIWNYAPRKVAKVIVTTMAMLAAYRLWRGVFKLLPVVGLVVETSLNKVLTMRVGQRVRADLRTRERLMRGPRKETAPRKRPAAKRARSAKQARVTSAR